MGCGDPSAACRKYLANRCSNNKEKTTSGTTAVAFAKPAQYYRLASDSELLDLDL